MICIIMHLLRTFFELRTELRHKLSILSYIFGDQVMTKPTVIPGSHILTIQLWQQPVNIPFLLLFPRLHKVSLNICKYSHRDSSEGFQ